MYPTLPRATLRRFAALLIATALGAPPALAQSAVEIPGLESDASGYAGELARRFPAGATAQLRQQAETRAVEAIQRSDWSAAAEALEQRIGMQGATPEHWLALAQAQLSRTPPNPQRALQAAWQNFGAVAAGEAEIPSLHLMARALQMMDRWPPAIAALEAVAERAPDDPAARALATARRAAGLLVSRTRTEPEADPPRACIAFTGTLSRASDLQPGDWVRAEPPIPDMAVSREDGQLCVAGLPWGRTTRLLLRAGLPGEDGARLRAETPVAITMPDREARLAFDATRFLLPRGQAARVGIATVNIPA
ncbi:hypothetical protein ACFQU7_27335 [Pseudoroseomonas wenyumeiae]